MLNQQSILYAQSQKQHLIIRVDSFVFFSSFAKYETVRNRSLFRRVWNVSRNWKNTKIRKKCFELFRETAKQCFVSYFSYKFCTSSLSFLPFNLVSYLLCKLYLFSSFIPFYPTPTPHLLPLPPLTTHTPHTHHILSPHTITIYPHHTLITHTAQTHHTHSPHPLTTYTHQTQSLHTH